MLLVKNIYVCTRRFPKGELYGFAIASCRRFRSSNIAEGQGLLSKKEFKQFVALARGSLLELETQLLIAADLQYLNASDAHDLLGETQEVLHRLNGLIRSLAV